MSNVNLQHYWMPFTDNRRFKAQPRLIAAAKDMYFTTVEGKQVLDGLATLWCVNAGHSRAPIVEAIRRQAGELDFASSFALGHPLPFKLAERIARLAPAGMEHVFFTNSGSEAVDTALKIAIAYHRLRGEGTRTRFIGRERSYHGVNIGGTSLGGVATNRKAYSGVLLPGVDHLRHTHDLSRNSFSKGQPAHGAELANELEERLIPLHDASNIAALIIDPVSASGGVLIPPKGYLERLREICTQHGILLIFDEVITGFGRLGRPFASQRFGVTPDLFTTAKGLTNATVPMGAVFVKDSLYEAFMQGPDGIELFHGYTYSGHPLACAAGLGTLQTYEEEGLLTRAGSLEKYWEDAAHSLKGARHVIDIRNFGLIAAIELEPRVGAPGRRAYEAFVKAFEAGVLIRVTGDIIALSPPLIVEKREIERLFQSVREVVEAVP
jgi:beta-alanine--pyruvate transaminase